MTAGGEGPLVQLVGPSGETVGYAPKEAAHQPPGAPHRAVSVLLLDANGRLLLQRRGFAKYHSGGRWTNTACGHPLPGEPPRAAAQRCLQVELGLVVPPEDLLDAGVVAYRVIDPVTGLVEAEFDHLFVGATGEEPSLNPEEVAAVATVDLEDPEPAALIADGFSAWYRIVVAAAAPALRRLRDT